MFAFLLLLIMLIFGLHIKEMADHVLWLLICVVCFFQSKRLKVMHVERYQFYKKRFLMMIPSILCFRCVLVRDWIIKGYNSYTNSQIEKSRTLKTTKKTTTNIQIGKFVENGLHRAVLSRNMYRVSSLVCYGMWYIFIQGR